MLGSSRVIKYAQNDYHDARGFVVLIDDFARRSCAVLPAMRVVDERSRSR